MKLLISTFLMLAFVSFGQISAPISGRITDMEGKPSPYEKIIFKGKKFKKSINAISKLDGTFSVNLPDNEIYLIKIESFQEASEYSQVEIPKAPIGSTFSEIRLDIQFEHAQSIVLNNIEFETGSSTLRSTAKEGLKKLSDFLKRKKQTKVRLTGHTDNVGEESKNISLSKERSLAVKKFLITNGCHGPNILCEGKGSSVPIASNDSESGRKMNRRTVIDLIK